MNQPTVRVFLALPLPAELKERISHAVQCSELPFKKWVYRSDYHMTIKFIGDIPPQKIETIAVAMRRLCAQQPPVRLALQGAGSFGKRSRPRILWSRVRGDLSSLHQLHQEVNQGLLPLGYEAESSYRPHITLARMYNGEEPFQENMLERLRWSEQGSTEWTAQALTLYQTKFGERPLYHVLEQFPFHS